MTDPIQTRSLLLLVRRMEEEIKVDEDVYDTAATDYRIPHQICVSFSFAEEQRAVLLL
jgi:hypothetical protein